MGESLYEYWERFKRLCASFPRHQICEQLLLQYFYERLNIMDRNMIDAMYCRKMVAYVDNEKLLIHYFLESLSDAALNCGPYYDKVIGNTSTLFADIVTIGERVGLGLKSGKIGKAPTSYDPRKIYEKKREEGVQAVIFTPKSQDTSQAKPRDEKVVDKIPTTNTKLLPQLLETSMIVRLPPTKKMDPPYPSWYKPEERCDYQSNSPGHSVERCKALQFRVQGLIDARWLKFDTNTPNIDKHPLHKHDEE
uniref:Retrotransposon gag domain-containing protein n=1 Tax=Cajanus cajan TaxID=3821 RepID=A0A151QVP6_CAJCA|nr:hypothetical protein KK1_044742 [Cajanus cajan]